MIVVGTITKIVISKGFGFISVPGQPKDCFFHMSELNTNLLWSESLVERRVSFDVLDTARGPSAMNIRPTT